MILCQTGSGTLRHIYSEEKLGAVCGYGKNSDPILMYDKTAQAIDCSRCRKIYLGQPILPWEPHKARDSTCKHMYRLTGLELAKEPLKFQAKCRLCLSVIWIECEAPK